MENDVKRSRSVGNEKRGRRGDGSGLSYYFSDGLHFDAHTTKRNTIPSRAYLVTAKEMKKEALFGTENRI